MIETRATAGIKVRRWTDRARTMISSGECFAHLYQISTRVRGQFGSKLPVLAASGSFC